MRWMRRIGLVVALHAAAGCEDLPSDGHSGDTDSGGSGLDRHSGTSSPTTNGVATQVGSEGFWGCPVEHVEPITDPTKVDARLGGPPSTVVAPYLGAWPLLIEDFATPGATSDGVLSLTAGDAWRWVDVTDGPDCADHVAVTVEAALTRPPGSPLTMAGVVAVRPDGLGAVEATAPRELLGPEWSPPTTAALWFRLEGSLAPLSLQATAAWADCPVSEPSCADQHGFATVTGSR